MAVRHDTGEGRVIQAEDELNRQLREVKEIIKGLRRNHRLGHEAAQRLLGHKEPRLRKAWRRRADKLENVGALISFWEHSPRRSSRQPQLRKRGADIR